MRARTAQTLSHENKHEKMETDHFKMCIIAPEALIYSGLKELKFSAHWNCTICNYEKCHPNTTRIRGNVIGISTNISVVFNSLLIFTEYEYNSLMHK